mgnify:CR=1 FL=1
MIQEWDAEVAREFLADGGWKVTVVALGAFADAGALRDVHGKGQEGMGIMERIAALVGHVRLSIRSLARAPEFTVVALSTLTIGLGGSAAIYTLLDRVVLDPLPYPDAERLVRLHNQVPGVGPDAVWSLSQAQYVYYQEQATTLDGLGLHRLSSGTLLSEAGPQRIQSATVTADMMTLLGARAHLGRLIDATDDQPGAPEVAVLSYAWWVGALGADPQVIGRVLTFADRPVEIIGVMAESVELPGQLPASAPALWLPMRVDRNGNFGNNHVFPAIGRLAEGSTTASLEVEMTALRDGLPDAFPNAYGEGFFRQYGFRTVGTPLRADVLQDLPGQIWVLFAGVLLVLAIACANVVNLFLVRVETRGQELSIRRALGASRGATARLVVSEGLVLATASGVMALAVGFWAVPVLAGLAPADLPRVHGVAIDTETALFTLMLSVIAGLAVTAWPALRLASGRSMDELTRSARGSSAGPGRGKLRSALVVAEMALTVSLLVGAGLLVESLRSLRNADPGFDPTGVVALDLHASYVRHPSDIALWNLHRDILDAVRVLPGVVAVGMGEELPVSGGYGCTVQAFDDEAVYERMRAAGMTTCAGQQRVTAGYFDALGIPLLEGRLLEAGDNDDPTRGSVVVSRAFADRFWPGEDALGRGVGPSGRTSEPFYRVVGVVDDVKKRRTEGQPPLTEDAVAVYYPSVHNPEGEGNWGFWWPGTTSLVVRTDGDTETLIPALRSAIQEIDPELAIANVRDMDVVVAGATAEVSFISLLLAIAAAAALALSAVGLYGVISYVVSRRRREIGTRLAIGAAPERVVRGVVWQTMTIAAAGLAVGLPLAWVVWRFGQSVLVGIQPAGPVTYLVAITAVAGMALLACWVPARRAAGVNPADALRAE